ncbi:MAG: D-alanine--D-alanine ligase family protein [Pseudobdellovibrionaceae bacterium]
MSPKKKVMIFFGGQSPEHEVSVNSTRNVAAALDKNKYDFQLLGISKEGSWHLFKDASILDKISSVRSHEAASVSELVTMANINGKGKLISLKNPQTQFSFDIAFPVMHGALCEDGSIQGLFDLMNLPYVSCGVLGSAVCMDKDVMKRLFRDAEIPSAKFVVLTPDKPLTFATLEKELGVPFFIKPANAGSSVGVHKIKSQADFEKNLKDAFHFDRKVLAETFVAGREVECSVLGHWNKPRTSVPGQIIPNHEFYSYEAKYIDPNGAATKIPADLDQTTAQKVQEWAIKAFQVLCCEGMARVDFFVTPKNEVYINELNTLPGFTKISMYPKMWEASGLKYSDLITELVELGLQEYSRKKALKTSYIE